MATAVPNGRPSPDLPTTGRWRSRLLAVSVPACSGCYPRTGAAAGHPQPAVEPIRVYTGLESASSPQEQAALVVAELERTGAFSRRVLCHHHHRYRMGRPAWDRSPGVHVQRRYGPGANSSSTATGALPRSCRPISTGRPSGSPPSRPTWTVLLTVACPAAGLPAARVRPGHLVVAGTAAPGTDL